MVGGVGNAGEEPVGAVDRQGVLVEPVADAVHQDGQPDQDRQMSLGGSAAAAAGAAEPQPAHRVVHDGRDDRADDQCGEGERQHEPPPRVAEDEERDVEPELRVVDVERLRVAPGQIFQGPTTGRAAGEQADDDTDDDQHPDESGLQQLPVALEQRAAGRLDAQPRPQPVGDRGVGDDARRHDQPEGHEQPDPGQQHLAEHRAVAERPVPQTVGPDAGEDRERHDQDRDDDQRRQNGAPSSADPQTAQTLISPQPLLRRTRCLGNDPAGPGGSARG